jgi:hypothetical protein
MDFNAPDNFSKAVLVTLALKTWRVITGATAGCP